MHDKTTKKRSTIRTNGEASEFEANLNAIKGNSLKLKKMKSSRGNGMAI